jgi:hypothetical protein
MIKWSANGVVKYIKETKGFALNGYIPTELSSLQSLTSHLGNSTIAETVIRGFRRRVTVAPFCHLRSQEHLVTR